MALVADDTSFLVVVACVVKDEKERIKRTWKMCNRDLLLIMLSQVVQGRDWLDSKALPSEEDLSLFQVLPRGSEVVALQ